MHGFAKRHGLFTVSRVLFVLCLVPSCGDDEAASGCVEGATQSCTCNGADVGVQICGAEGAWGACDCGGGADTDSDADTDSEADISGSVQKGPFVVGSTVQVAMLNASGATTGVVFNAQTTDDLGDFSLAAGETGYSELIGDGYYFNEITNAVSGSTLSLRALYEIAGGAGQTAYLNVFTHMSSGRALALLEGGATLENAVAQAEGELYAALGVLHPDPANMGHGTSMDLTGADSPDNEYLMAVSCIVDNAAALDATVDGDVDGKLQLLVNSIRSDLEDDGDISTELKAKLRDGEEKLDPNTDCAANLSAYLEQQTGTAPNLPDPEQACDNDDDGVANADDDDIDGDGVVNADDTNAYNPNILGGIWTDDATGLVWQREPPDVLVTWQDAVDYCDAMVLSGYDDWHLPTISELRSFIRGCPDTVLGGECSITDDNLESQDPDAGVGSCYQSCGWNAGPAPGGCYYDTDVMWRAISDDGWIDCLTYWSSSENESGAWSVSFSEGRLEERNKADYVFAGCVRGSL